MSFHPCCLKGFEWDGTPTGHTEKLANLDVYVAGNSPSAAVLIIHDLLGWSFPNVRLLADHYAREANVTAYVPDFFGGEVLPFDIINADRWSELNLPDFFSRNSREIREPEIFACAKALRQNYAKVGAVGFCYGGWAVFRLGASDNSPPLVDCITAGHPSLLTKADIEGVAVPVQVLAPEIDPAYTLELKRHTFETMLGKKVAFDYQHFPGVHHACLVRGDEHREGEMAAMERGKNAAVAWMKQYLGDINQ
ncbi:hypothetical protein G7046_g7074 [Stylonectria norvegica]|nr:hypothetical protein G7046_g7074 [Stylonectria norvegica]